MAKLLPLLPSPYNQDSLNRDLTVSVPQGDTAEFLFIATSLDGVAITSSDKLKISLADGTQESPIIWEGSWANTIAETASETPNVYRAVIPYAITKTLREGSYSLAVAAEFIVSAITKNETLAVGTLYVVANPASPVRNHPYVGWSKVADFTETFDIEQAVTPGTTESVLVIPAGCVLQDLTTVYLSGFDPALLFDIVVSIDAITVYFSDEAAGTAPLIKFQVVKTNVEEARPV
jgi:hypothetical protein